MPTPAEHLAKAKSNELFAQAIDRSNTAGAEWAIVILFYVAVHHIQAYFSSIGKTYTHHTARDSAIRRDENLSGIYDDYRELETYSRDARYDVPQFRESDFQKLIPRLKNIKKCVAQFL